MCTFRPADAGQCSGLQVSAWVLGCMPLRCPIRTQHRYLQHHSWQRLDLRKLTACSGLSVSLSLSLSFSLSFSLCLSMSLSVSVSLCLSGFLRPSCPVIRTEGTVEPEGFPTSCLHTTRCSVEYAVYGLSETREVYQQFKSLAPRSFPQTSTETLFRAH